LGSAAENLELSSHRIEGPRRRRTTTP